VGANSFHPVSESNILCSSFSSRPTYNLCCTYTTSSFLAFFSLATLDRLDRLLLPDPTRRQPVPTQPHRLITPPHRPNRVPFGRRLSAAWSDTSPPCSLPPGPPPIFQFGIPFGQSPVRLWSTFWSVFVPPPADVHHLTRHVKRPCAPPSSPLSQLLSPLFGIPISQLLVRYLVVLGPLLVHHLVRYLVRH
jgi:hypothetical protein